MPDKENSEGLDPAILKMAGILLVGVLAPLFDTTIVNVAIDTLRRDLHTTVSDIQWVTTGYLLALAMVIPLTGWTVDRFGGKRMWMASLTIFLIGSVLSGLSWNVGSLVAFRILQGVGGGLMLPILQTLLVQATGGRNLGKLMAVVSLPTLIGPILGPVLGGVLVDRLDWRWIFFINVPICIIALLLAWHGLTDSGERRTHPFDTLGLVLLSPALAALIYGLSQVGVKSGFGHPTVIAPLGIGATLLLAFCVHALTTSRKPIIELRLFRKRTFTASSLLLFLSGLSLYGAMLLLPLYFQQIRGQSALAAGLLLAPQGIGTLLTRGQAGSLTDRIGARPVVIGGMVLASLGTLAYTQADAHTNMVLLCLSLVVRGAGLGAVTVPIMAVAYQGLDRAEIGDASSATRILQQVGGSFGTAIVAVVLQNAATSPGEGGLSDAYDRTFWWTLGFTVIALIPCLLLPRVKKVDVPIPTVPEPPSDTTSGQSPGSVVGE